MAAAAATAESRSSFVPDHVTEAVASLEVPRCDADGEVALGACWFTLDDGVCRGAGTGAASTSGGGVALSGLALPRNKLAGLVAAPDDSSDESVTRLPDLASRSGRVEMALRLKPPRFLKLLSSASGAAPAESSVAIDEERTGLGRSAAGKSWKQANQLSLHTRKKVGRASAFLSSMSWTSSLALLLTLGRAGKVSGASMIFCVSSCVVSAWKGRRPKSMQ
mmetsp:Transcript_15658/g.49889  ORF Transcript_15658/g.49889 Transcript_15658/m.49889 type:complete len:221 (+) Transcript_15658:200-862(+)